MKGLWGSHPYPGKKGTLPGNCPPLAPPPGTTPAPPGPVK